MKDGDRVLITGASGGVGSAAIQIARDRGAEVIGIAQRAKWPTLTSLGAHELLNRDTDLIQAPGRNRPPGITGLPSNAFSRSV